jgi:hypothetical protein
MKCEGRSFIAEFMVAAAFFAAVCITFTGASHAGVRRTHQILIEYAEPKNPAHKPIYRQMKELRVLEHIQGVLASIRLHKALLLKFVDCGMSNAWYDGVSIAVCYEYVDEILKNSPKKPLPIDIAPEDTIMGPLMDVFLHEAAHAIFDQLQVPVLGREEDAADQISAYVLLQYDKTRARGLLLGAAYQYTIDMRSPESTAELTKFSDVHGIPAQRFFNVLCIGYGADPQLFADVVERKYSLQYRAEVCKREYQQVRFAFKKLIGPHIDKRAVNRLLKNLGRSRPLPPTAHNIGLTIEPCSAAGPTAMRRSTRSRPSC